MSIKKVRITNLSRDFDASVVASCREQFWGKMRGLMFMKSFGDGDSILIDQGFDSKINSAIHMLFMRFEIAAIWINSNHLVVDTTLAKPWKLACIPSHPARFVLETHTRHLDHFMPGDQLEFHYV